MASGPNTGNFADSQAMLWHRFVRKSIKGAPITRAQRDVLVSVFNFWVHHQGKGNALVYPGREKLARRAKVTIKTVSRSLALFRERDVLTVVSHPKGGWGTATHYALNLDALLMLCGHSLPVVKGGELELLSCQNVPHFFSKMSHTLRDKMSHEYNNVSCHVFTSQGIEVDDAKPSLRLIDGGRR